MPRQRENKLSEDEIRLVQMRELWADVRESTSNIWQIVGFTAVAFSLFLDLDLAESVYDLFILSFYLSVMLFALQGVIWKISQQTKTRINLLCQLEIQLSERETFSFVISGGERKDVIHGAKDEVSSARYLTWFPV